MQILFSKAPDIDTSHIFSIFLYLLYCGYDSHISGSERYPVASLKCSSLYKSHLHEKPKVPIIPTIAGYLSSQILTFSEQCSKSTALSLFKTALMSPFSDF